MTCGTQRLALVSLAAGDLRPSFTLLRGRRFLVHRFSLDQIQVRCSGIHFVREGSRLFIFRKRVQGADHYIVPGGSSHVDREATERVDQEAVLVSGRYLLACVEVAFGNTLDQGVEGIAVHLERGRYGRQQRDIRYTMRGYNSTLELTRQYHPRSVQHIYLSVEHVHDKLSYLC